jgi:hypothetical protein
MRAALFATTLAAGCAPAAVPVTSTHPGMPTAPTGRLAGPPPALRAAATTDADHARPAAPVNPGHQHGTGSPAAPATHEHDAGPETKPDAKDAPKDDPRHDKDKTP